MLDKGTREVLLSRWAEEFLLRYKPDSLEDIEYRRICENLMMIEDRDTPKSLYDDYAPNGVPLVSMCPAYDLGRIKALKWDIPITALGLMVAVSSCHNPEQVDMILAMLYSRYLKIDRALGKRLDARYVYELLQKGTPSQEHYEDMWKQQKISVNGDEVPDGDLLKMITAADFR